MGVVVFFFGDVRDSPKNPCKTPNGGGFTGTVCTQYKYVFVLSMSMLLYSHIRHVNNLSQGLITAVVQLHQIGSGKAIVVLVFDHLTGQMPECQQLCSGNKYLRCLIYVR